MKNIEVVAAIIINSDQILCVQRGSSKYTYISEKYEFPGGKVESAETQQEALAREIQEELSLEIEVGKKYMTVEHSYPDFSITMHAYLCRCANRLLVLHEHIDYKWLNVSELKGLDWAAADVPIVNKFAENVSC